MWYGSQHTHTHHFLMILTQHLFILKINNNNNKIIFCYFTGLRNRVVVGRLIEHLESSGTELMMRNL